MSVESTNQSRADQLREAIKARPLDQLPGSVNFAVLLNAARQVLGLLEGPTESMVEAAANAIADYEDSSLGSLPGESQRKAHVALVAALAQTGEPMRVPKEEK